MFTRREFLLNGLTSAFSINCLANRIELFESKLGDREFEKTDPVTIDSFDGTEIVATLFEPSDRRDHPAILMTHGWGGTRRDVEALAKFYVSHGYVVLTYDSRGFGASGGEVTVTGPKEVSDAQTLITWLALRENVTTDGSKNPRIGMDGYSYGAGTQLMTAIVDDRLDALVPRWAWHDLRFSNDPNSVLKWPWFYGLYLSGKKNGNPQEQFLQLSQEAIETKQASEELREFWQSRSPVGKLGCIDTPTLLISGWEDRLFTPNETFANYRGLHNTGTETRLVMYDYGHDFVDFSGDGPETQTEFADSAALAWMNAHLKDDAADLPPVSLYRSQTGDFETYDELPSVSDVVPLATRDETSSSKLMRTKRTDGTTNQSVTFEFAFSEPLDIIGIPRLWLSVTPTGESPQYIFGTLQDVGPSGEATIIKDQVAATSVEQEGLLRFDLIGIERHIPANHTLQLTLTLNDDTLIEDAIPFGDGLYIDSEAPSGVVVKHSPGAPSTLAVPTLDGTVALAGRCP